MTKKDLHKYIGAFLLGDAGVYYSGVNCRMVTNSVEGEYITWKRGILEELTAVNYNCKIDKREDFSRKPLHILTTRTHPIYTQFRNRVYTDAYRGVDPHTLKMMDWEMLAILYMDDGGCSVDKRCDATPAVCLHTKRLSYGDSWLLKKSLKDSLELEFNIYQVSHRYYLRLRSKDYAAFKAGVSPFVLPCYQYKLP